MDNKSAIEWGKSQINHERSIHIGACFYFIQEHVKEGNVEMAATNGNARLSLQK